MAFALPTGARGQVLALALTMLAASAIWIGAVSPIWRWYDDRADLLRRQEAMARRMAVLVETLPAARRQTALVADGPAADGGILLPGATDALAAASLQLRIDKLAADAGVRIASEEILPGQPAERLRAISVRLTMNAPYRPLVTLMSGLARSETPMVVDELLIRGPPPNTNADAALPVDASMTVTSYRAASDADR